MTITTPAPRVYVHGSLRTIRDSAATAYVHAAVISSTVADDNGTYYAQTSEAIHSQQTDWPVGSDGEWVAELVWAPGVTYQLSAPGYMPDAYLDCDTHASGSTFEAADLLVPPGGGTVVAPMTLSDLTALVDAKMGLVSSRRAMTPMYAALAGDRLRVMIMGDSKAVGAAATSVTNGWARLLLARLRSEFGSVDTGWGFMAADNSYPGLTPAPTLSAGAAAVLNNAGLGVRTVVLDDTETVTWPAQTCNKVTVFYSKSDFFPGTADVKIDGAVVGSFDSTPAPGGPGTFIDSSGHTLVFDVAAGSHVVQIVGTAAGGSAHVDGVHFQTDESGITLYDAAHGGFSASMYATGVNPGGPGYDIPASAVRCHYEAVAEVAPHLVIVALGANDMQLGYGGLQSWRLALLDVIAKLRVASPGCGIILLVGTARLEDADDLGIVRAYEAAARAAVGNTPGVTVLYESDLWLPNPEAPFDDVGWLADGVHPSNFGHSRIAAYVARVILQDEA